MQHWVKHRRYTLEFRAVMALFNKLSRSARSRGMALLFNTSSALLHPCTKDSAMDMGWIPRAIRVDTAPNRAPASTHTVVVPSPASISCALASSTNCESVRTLCYIKTERGKYHFGSRMLNFQL